MVHTTDIASAAAEEIQTLNSKKIRYVVSDERTADEIAEVLGNAIGKPQLEWEKVSDKKLQEALLANGMPTHAAANLVEVGAGIHSGVLEGINSKIQLVKRRARGYRNTTNFINMIYFTCGKLKFDYPQYLT